MKLDENISSFLRNPDLLSAIDKAFEGKNLTDFEIEIRNQSTFRLNITIYLDKTNLFFDETSCFLFIRDLKPHFELIPWCLSVYKKKVMILQGFDISRNVCILID